MTPGMRLGLKLWLAACGAAYAGLMIADFRHFGMPILPIDILSLVFYHMPWWFGWLPLLGCWLLVRAWTVAGGRWAWRWLIGGMMVVSYGHSLVSEAIRFQGGPNFWAEPFTLLCEIPVILTIIPVCLLARGRRIATDSTF